MIMKPCILYIILCILNKSWQKESSESLNDTLDRLIKQTNSANVAGANDNTDFEKIKNNSRIFYIGSESLNESSKQQTKESSFKSGAKTQTIAEILHQLLTSGSNKVPSDKDAANKNDFKEITVTVENNKPQNSEPNSDGVQQIIEYLSRSGKPPLESIPEDAILTFESDTDNNSLHKYPEFIIDRITYHNGGNKTKTIDETDALVEKQAIPNDDILTFDSEIEDSLLKKYPEIIIDRITYHNNENRNEKATETDTTNGEPANGQQNVEKYTKEQSYKPILSEEMNMILAEILKIKEMDYANEKNNEQAVSDNLSPHTVENTIQQPCGKVMFPCASNSILTKIQEHQNLHHIIHQAGIPHLGSTFQLNGWGLNARQNALMSILRAQKLKRIHFITELINNMMSRFVYRPLL